MQSHFTNNIFISKSRVITKLQASLLLSCYFTQGLKKIQSQRVAHTPSVLETGYADAMAQPPPAAPAAASSLCSLFLPSPASGMLLPVAEPDSAGTAPD